MSMVTTGARKMSYSCILGVDREVELGELGGWRWEFGERRGVVLRFGETRQCEGVEG